MCGEVSVHAVSTPSSVLPSLPMSDLLAAESLMDEDDTTVSRCCEGRLTADDADPFASVLHLTDHCLYRIVRWARNRPDFANISVRLLSSSWTDPGIRVRGCCPLFRPLPAFPSSPLSLRKMVPLRESGGAQQGPGQSPG